PAARATAPARIATGGQLASTCASDASTGALGAASAGLPPNRLLKRSPKDCDDAGEAIIMQPTANEAVAIAAIFSARLSPIRRPLTPHADCQSLRYSRAMTANPRHAPRHESKQPEVIAWIIAR